MTNTEAGELPGIRGLIPAERETHVSTSDADDIVRIWTAQRPYITKLRKNPAFTEVASGHYGTTAWAEFTISAEQWNPATGAKRRGRTLSAEERVAAAQRLAEARAARRA